MRATHPAIRVRSIPAALVALVFVAVANLSSAEAGSHQPYKFDAPGRILDVRVADVNGDGRADLVLLVELEVGKQSTVVVLPSPATPKPGGFFDTVPPGLRHHTAGAVVAGRFGKQTSVRFLTGDGLVDVVSPGTEAPGVRPPATMLARSGQEALVFWDGVGDLNGDGLDECWFPKAEGEGAFVVVDPSGAVLCTLSLTAKSAGSHSADHSLGRDVTIPKLVPADLDGDGIKELVALDGTRLLGWRAVGSTSGGATAGNGPLAPSFEMELPFLAPDPTLPPEALRTARIQLADVNADGKADLLVTFLTGRRDKLGDLKTILFHYPGPFRAKDGTLVAPASRIDTPSVVLHPSFVDIDGDGDLDYVADSIRTKNKLELLARMMGNDPPVTLEAFRFDKDAGKFESAPAFRMNRTYPSSEAMGNTFGQTVWFQGDFDGDGRRDLLDLGTLHSIEVLPGKAGTGAEPIAFGEATSTFPMPSKLTSDARIMDLNADGKSDVVVWSDKSLFLLVSKER